MTSFLMMFSDHFALKIWEFLNFTYSHVTSLLQSPIMTYLENHKACPSVYLTQITNIFKSHLPSSMVEISFKFFPTMSHNVKHKVGHFRHLLFLKKYLLHSSSFISSHQLQSLYMLEVDRK